MEQDSGVGAGIDSFYEYMLKAYILFGEPAFLDAFQEAYKAIMTHVRFPPGFFPPVHMHTGKLLTTWIGWTH